MDFDNLHQLLRQLYNDMMPLCGDMVGVAKGIAGLGALFYVAYRVWQSLARAEPIDVFPLLRPFAIGLCIMFFPTIVIGTINSVMSPIVQGTHSMMENQTMDMEEYARQRDQLEYEIKMRSPETAYLVDDAALEAKLSELGVTDVGAKVGLHMDRAAYNFKKWLQRALRDLLELLFQAAALVIDVVRTFFLIVLSILGPIAFAFAVWDGFQSSLTGWLMRYISVYLWLPVSDLFSSILARIQSLMLQADIERMRIDPDFSLDSSDAVFIIFMIIGIIGYFTIPTVAGWIVQAGGGGALSKGINSSAVKAGAIAGGVAGAAAGNVSGGVVAGGKVVGGKLMQGTRSMMRSGGRSSNSNDGNASNGPSS
ncbi:conjugative transposon TraJ protein [Dysgonomonas sp. PFB1-18]|uniref:conjugative transposon protein TraJ n=1 Tax=unclassified Dysgonomonas TaxID=2630389 RepID=UPI002476E699|nr:MULTISPECIES: conjugative transposon protein TraJ [unclassified Dysgonomonas]MDH6311169.1 conjugative transposon TraJ protein [Dysgonomonas sp. PF1-14]MDH6341047.1 conjugative transposon TraJ protein [Dysgonomonas sp. PF1-16]MDH6382744.1 conjugative transposon TraJ protein [Dysgonomonas sp. PFB1-18]MDH6400041.1 conjugative transposon TraJ protein [Dysgonomonas sp. PF1-23]